jgi:hypothetical protein
MGTGSPGKRWAGREAMCADERHARSELLETWGRAALGVSIYCNKYVGIFSIFTVINMFFSMTNQRIP